MRTFHAHRTKRLAASLICAGVTVSGCTVPAGTNQSSAPSTGSTFTDVFASPNPCSNNAEHIGLAAGILTGLVVQHFLGNGYAKAAVLLAAPALGYVIGREVDARRCHLYELAQQNNLRLVSAPITAADLGVAASNPAETVGFDVELQNSTDEFVPGTADLTPQAQGYLGQIAQQYKPTAAAPGTPAADQAAVDQQQAIVIVGHTSAADDVSPKQSAELSEARAQAIASVFASNGVPSNHIFTQGAGTALPIESETVAEGQAANERTTIVQLADPSEVPAYLDTRKPDPRLLQPPSAVAVSTPVTQYASYDFGGTAVAGSGTPVDLGQAGGDTVFGIIPAANAAQEAKEPSCLVDQPHLVTAVKNFGTGSTLDVGDYTPGFYGAPWTGSINGNLIAELNVYVPRDAALPVQDPLLELYRHYDGTQKHASFEQHPDVDVYRGSKALLYRTFVDDGPVRCIDLVVSADGFSGTGYVYYPSHGEMYEAEGSFAVQR